MALMPALTEPKIFQAFQERQLCSDPGMPANLVRQCGTTRFSGPDAGISGLERGQSGIRKRENHEASSNTVSDTDPRRVSEAPPVTGGEPGASNSTI